SSRMPWWASTRPRQATSDSSSASIAPGMPGRFATTAPTSSSTISRSCWRSRHDHAPVLCRRAVVAERNGARPRRARSDGVGVRVRSLEGEWPAGAAVRVHSPRVVSFVQRSIAAILYEVEPVDGPLRVVVQSELVANEPGGAVQDDPRAAAVLESPLLCEE